jgi:rhodanese-related sulfurtransferase
MSGNYAGDVTVQQAWDLLRNDPRAVLVDVRTEPEWMFVGVPALADAGKDLVRVCWQVFPAMHVNSLFAEDVARNGVEPDDKILMLCRSGVRSIAAAEAMTAAGYKNCYNILGGFEGPPDQQRHRGTTGGWKAAGLPWEQP